MGVVAIYKWIASLLPKSSKIITPESDAIVEVSRGIIDEQSKQDQEKVIEAVASDAPEYNLANLLNGISSDLGDD